jgi:hypothetical protein
MSCGGGAGDVEEAGVAGVAGEDEEPPPPQPSEVTSAKASVRRGPTLKD